MDLSGSLQGAGGVGGLLKESEFDSNSQLQTSHFCLYEANGNITQKLDTVGNVVMNVSYDPFGNVISGTLVGEYGFSTKPFVDGPDWYYYGFRYYDPVTGRWPSRDPLGEYGGLNLYVIVGNNSLNDWDYLGLHCRDCQTEKDACYTNAKNKLKTCKGIVNRNVSSVLRNNLKRQRKIYSAAKRGYRIAYRNMRSFCRGLPRIIRHACRISAESNYRAGLAAAATQNAQAKISFRLAATIAISVGHAICQSVYSSDISK